MECSAARSRPGVRIWQGAALTSSYRLTLGAPNRFRHMEPSVNVRYPFLFSIRQLRECLADERNTRPVPFYWKRRLGPSYTSYQRSPYLQEGRVRRARAHDRASRPECITYAKLLPTGSRRTRLPVAAKIAFANAGASGGTPVSPIPSGASVLGTTYTSISGASLIRSTR